MMRRLAVATLMFSVVFLGLPMMGGSQGATADQYFQYGNKLYQTKDYANAAKYYQASVQLNPGNAPAFQALGNCYYFTNRKAEAVAAYEKALALNPNSPQLAAYVQNLKNQLGATAPAAAVAAPAAAAAPAATAVATPASANPGLQYLSQGGALFQQKQYAAAIPYFQQAAQLMPTDYRASYYLAYSQYMNRDFKNAAVNFYLANQKQPNASIKAYADRVKASLPPADQQWVDAQTAGTATVNATSPKAAVSKKAPVVFGARALFGVATVKLKDFNDDADYQSAYATSHGYGLTGQVPKGNIWIGAEPFFKPVPAFEVGLGLGIFPVGKYFYTATGATAITGGSPGYGTPSSGYPGDVADRVRNEMKVNTSEISLTARYYVGKDKVKGFLGAGLGFYPASVDWTRVITAGDLNYPELNKNYSGTFKKTGIGEHVMLGCSFKLGQNVTFDPYVMYRLAKLKTLTGSIDGESGTLSAITKADGTKYIGVNPAAGETATPLELDLSGVQAGLGISIFF